MFVLAGEAAGQDDAAAREAFVALAEEWRREQAAEGESDAEEADETGEICKEPEDTAIPWSRLQRLVECFSLRLSLDDVRPRSPSVRRAPREAEAADPSTDTEEMVTLAEFLFFMRSQHAEPNLQPALHLDRLQANRAQHNRAALSRKGQTDHSSSAVAPTPSPATGGINAEPAGVSESMNLLHCSDASVVERQATSPGKQQSAWLEKGTTRERARGRRAQGQQNLTQDTVACILNSAWPRRRTSEELSVLLSASDGPITHRSSCFKKEGDAVAPLEAVGPAEDDDVDRGDKAASTPESQEHVQPGTLHRAPVSSKNSRRRRRKAGRKTPGLVRGMQERMALARAMREHDLLWENPETDGCGWAVSGNDEPTKVSDRDGSADNEYTLPNDSDDQSGKGCLAARFSDSDAAPSSSADGYLSESYFFPRKPGFWSSVPLSELLDCASPNPREQHGGWASFRSPEAAGRSLQKRRRLRKKRGSARSCRTGLGVDGACDDGRSLDAQTELQRVAFNGRDGDGGDGGGRPGLKRRAMARFRAALAAESPADAVLSARIDARRPLFSAPAPWPTGSDFLFEGDRLDKSLSIRVPLADLAPKAHRSAHARTQVASTITAKHFLSRRRAAPARRRPFPSAAKNSGKNNEINKNSDRTNSNNNNNNKKKKKPGPKQRARAAADKDQACEPALESTSTTTLAHAFDYRSERAAAAAATRSFPLAPAPSAAAAAPAEPTLPAWPVEVRSKRDSCRRSEGGDRRYVDASTRRQLVAAAEAVALAHSKRRSPLWHLSG
ncbi:hypothetical protein DIPPA_19471 [Diplonema papillatum]|nr:hypothetical protein DIPPA_19471 [Diplonema papillatum]